MTVVRGFRRADPFLDPRLFRSVAFSSAALVSVLTGFAFATAIIGGAVFVDRVLFGGPDDQRLALGALAAATALGALLSGFAVRVLSLRLVTLAGLLLSAGMLGLMSQWTPATTITTAALVLGGFGLGFGLTVTPRSTAAVESAGRASFGMASAMVTVARMIGMAIGVAILTAYGSTTIDRLYDRLFSAANPDGWKDVIPAELRDRPLRDGLVVDALEAWEAREASSILVGMFLAAGVVTIIAIPPGLALGGRTRRLTAEPAATGAVGAPEQEAATDAMAETRPDRPSRSDGPAGTPSRGDGLERTADPGTPDDPHQTRTPLGAFTPGAVRIIACNGDDEVESTDLADLPRLIAAPGHRIWVDLASPDEAQVTVTADALGLHPLIAEDIRERNQRSKIESFDEDVVHIVLFALHYSGEAGAAEVDFVLGNGYLLTVHDGALGPSAAAPLRFGVGARACEGPRLPVLRDRRHDRRRLLPGPRQARRRHRRPPGPGHGDGLGLDPPAALRDEARAGRTCAGRPRRPARSSTSSRTARSASSTRSTSSTSATSTTTSSGSPTSSTTTATSCRARSTSTSRSSTTTCRGS